ncbi:hypothetical protein [Xanthobacter aminoxidans]|uniref:hypothetical protein n=1 Tax=Xanthobacter aminoxidans TaxID=186280 RepID=UPI003727ECC3
MSPASTPSPNTPHRPSARPARDMVADLAEDMRELAAFTGAATEDALLRIGWTPDQLRDLAPAARRRLGPLSEVGHG